MTTREIADTTSRPPWGLPLAVGAVALAVAAACGQWTLTVAFDLPRGYAISGPLTSVVLAVVGALVLVRGRGHRHGYGVLVLLTGVLYATQGLAEAWVDLAWIARPDVEWPFALAAAWYQDTWMLLQMLLFLLLPALFPDGRPASPAWARAVRVTTAAWLVVIVAFLTMDRPLTGLFEDHPEIMVPNPLGLWPETTLDSPEITGIPWLAVSFVSVVIGIGSLVSHWRRDEGVVRPQFVVVGAGFFVLLVTTAIAGLNILLVEVMGVDLGLTGPVTMAFGLATVVCAVAFGVAVLRYRLFEIDLVVNRTIVYGLLTLGVVVTYAVLVIGVGAVLPGASDQGLALAATGVVAVAFDPARRRLQRQVNRVVFGLRDEPYELLAHLGEVVAGTGSPDDSLQTLVDTVATSLKLPWVAIELDQRDGHVVRAEHGSREAAGVGSCPCRSCTGTRRWVGCTPVRGRLVRRCDRRTANCWPTSPGRRAPLRRRRG